MPRQVHHLTLNNRSYRRFRENYPVPLQFMTEWVDNARQTGSAANKQPLRYRIVSGKEDCAKVFDTLKWAGYLTDWDGPEPGERPTGYIVMTCDTTVSSTQQCQIDTGIAAQTILLGAVEEGFGGCMILSFAKQSLIDALDIPDHLDPVLVIALGRPTEVVQLVDMENDDVKYYRDENKVHYVPKRKLEDVLF